MRLLVCAIFILSCVWTIAEGGPLEFAGDRGRLERLEQAPFGEAIDDWLRDVKARLADSPMELPDISAFIESRRDSYERQKRLFEDLLIDLANVDFDPDKDWGLRLGNWYVIRKTSGDAIRSLWNLIHPGRSDGSTTDDDWIDLTLDDNTEIPYSANTIESILPEVDEPSSESSEEDNSRDNETIDAYDGPSDQSSK